MPICLPRKRASASSSSCCNSWPATMTEPVSGRSSPVITISSVDFAGAGRAEEANRLATAYIEVDLAQDMDAGGAAAERQVDAGERDGVAEGWLEMSFMLPADPRPSSSRRARSYGWRRALIQIAGAAVCSVALFARDSGAVGARRGAGQNRRVRRLADGRLWAARQRRFCAPPASSPCRQRYCRGNRKCRRLRRHCR